MTLPDLKNKRFAILGLQGSGKSELSRQILKTEPAHLVYDVHHEYEGMNRYLVEHKQVVNPGKSSDPGIAELNRVVTMIVLDSGKIRLFLADEMNRYCPSKYPLPGAILRLNDDSRHEKIAFGVIARRAVQLNTDLLELAHYIFIFRLPGKNDRQYLEGMSEGLGDAVRELPEYSFMVVDPSRNFTIHPPLEISEPFMTRS